MPAVRGNAIAGVPFGRPHHSKTPPLVGDSLAVFVLPPGTNERPECTALPVIAYLVCTKWGDVQPTTVTEPAISEQYRVRSHPRHFLPGKRKSKTAWPLRTPPGPHSSGHKLRFRRPGQRSLSRPMHQGLLLRYVPFAMRVREQENNLSVTTGYADGTIARRASGSNH